MRSVLLAQEIAIDKQVVAESLVACVCRLLLAFCTNIAISNPPWLVIRIDAVKAAQYHIAVKLATTRIARLEPFSEVVEQLIKVDAQIFVVCVAFALGSIERTFPRSLPVEVAHDHK